MMNNDRRGWAMGTVVWVFVVLAGSSLVWVVISRAGAGVAPQPGASVAAGDPVAGTAPPTSPPSTRPPTRSTTERPTLRPEPRPSSPTSSPAAGPSTSASPSAAPTGGSEPAPGSRSSQTPTPPSASTGASASRRTWSGTGGSVVVECTGNRIRLVAAQPDGGFAVEVGHRGPDEVEVKFDGRGDEERESEVHAVCVGGAPRFSAESHRED